MSLYVQVMSLSWHRNQIFLPMVPIGKSHRIALCESHFTAAREQLRIAEQVSRRLQQKLNVLRYKHYVVKAANRFQIRFLTD